MFLPLLQDVRLYNNRPLCYTVRLLYIHEQQFTCVAQGLRNGAV